MAETAVAADTFLSRPYETRMNHFHPSLESITFPFSSLSFSLSPSIPHHHRETYDSVENGPPLNEIVNFERRYL